MRGRGRTAMSSSALVVGSTIPSGTRPAIFWKASTAWVVAVEKAPSGDPSQNPRSIRRCWMMATAGPVSPARSPPPACGGEAAVTVVDVAMVGEAAEVVVVFATTSTRRSVSHSQCQDRTSVVVEANGLLLAKEGHASPRRPVGCRCRDLWPCSGRVSGGPMRRGAAPFFAHREGPCVLDHRCAVGPVNAAPGIDGGGGGDRRPVRSTCRSAYAVPLMQGDDNASD